MTSKQVKEAAQDVRTAVNDATFDVVSDVTADNTFIWRTANGTVEVTVKAF